MSEDEPVRHVRRRPGARTVIAAGLALLVVVLAVATGVLGARLANLRAERDNRIAALQAAREAVLNVVSFDYRHLNEQFNVLRQQSTGTFLKSIGQYESQVRARFSSAKLVSRGVVDDAAVASATSSKATILVAMDDTIEPLGGPAPSSGPQRYRMIVTMVKKDARWLIENITVAA